VRPCAFNEFLAPQNYDECIPCERNHYNLNFTDTQCAVCPAHADCGSPGGREPFLLPMDGYWHSSIFSEQVQECPNPSACSYTGRDTSLALLQQEVGGSGTA
jgi:Tyrosine-protein kinase ephrin type A/B receptor-like